LLAIVVHVATRTEQDAGIFLKPSQLFCLGRREGRNRSFRNWRRPSMQDEHS
jgi:hypothetical protein